jgi:hypothetical protein
MTGKEHRYWIIVEKRQVSARGEFATNGADVIAPLRAAISESIAWRDREALLIIPGAQFQARYSGTV